ncbi:hypothetical protein ALC60_00482 [Trachymyrmex zeteki]|uniref:Uncharacterized protein n=1 Tax=Mycetomoellerius zeteki TaxID=64791 RepID=A0A151XJD5_9HYME|nr:hypothetical protein ALC60_00482 [Trachymyrmex zeteki]
MDHLDGKETKEAEGADVMSLRKVTRKRQTRGKAIREYHRKKQHEKATEKFGRTIPRLQHGYDVAQDKEKNAPQAATFVKLYDEIKGISWRTNRRSRQESNFHRGNVGNLEIDIGEIRRIVTGSSKLFERKDIRRWLPEERAIKVVCGNLITKIRQDRHGFSLPDSHSPPQLNFEGGRITIKSSLDAVKNHAAVAIASTAVATAILGKSPGSEIAGRIKRRRIRVDLCGKSRERKRRED